MSRNVEWTLDELAGVRVRRVVRWDDVLADRERRDRGVTLQAWLAAPATPRTEADCPDARPCPHLRCEYHLGLRGDGSYTCELDVRELPDEERTFDLIARVTGSYDDTTRRDFNRARDKFERSCTDDDLKRLGIRRRHA